MKPARVLFLLGLTPLLFGARLIESTTPEPILAIEEDWEVTIGEPDLLACGPQLTTTMSPVGNTEVQSMSFNLNYREDPFRTGGTQLRSWEDGTLVAEKNHRLNQLATSGEQIAWTQRMELAAGVLSYQIKNGQSTTWGVFGNGDPEVKVASTSGLSSLAAYTPVESIKNSGSGWQSNRVASMKLVRIRYYTASGLDHEDVTEKVVIPNAAP